MEIREIILKLSLSETWNGKTPGLIVALRCHKELYSHTSEIFQKTNWFYLSNQSRLQLFKSMPQTVLANIRRINITIWPLTPYRHPRLNDIKGCLKSCQKLEELRLVLSSVEHGTQHLDKVISDWAGVIFHQCKVLKAFTLGFSSNRTATLPLGRRLSEMRNLPQPLTFITTIEKLSYNLGVDASQEWISANGLSGLWNWTAEEGKNLTWKDGLGQMG
ncbi:hypothetical protein N431DRAFT_450804 [Stipitochalara longipes BDJ]|nr:hypothetical protein N431DRAFT_450804 [Stipitochalara longipes BDJ]